MDEGFLVLLSWVAELLLEVLFQIGVEAITGLVVRSIRDRLEETPSIHPVVAAVGYLFLGAVVGIVSLLIYPRPFVRPSKFHGISLIISPIITGLVMSGVGTSLRTRGKRPVRVESFGYGFALALGMAVTRFAFAR